MLQRTRSLVKFILSVLLLVNIRSFPFAWHLRVFLPALPIRARGLLLRLRTSLSTRTVRQRASTEFLESLCPVGAHPLDFTTTYRSWASPDECDFNGHLSNSSFAKALDAARFKLATASFPLFFHARGWMPLAGTHYAFAREIPRLARYEIRMSVAAWDAKWIYVTARFVTPPRAGASTTAHGTEADGATLHCVSVSQCCFKHGRITVPPAVVLASHGFSAPPAPGGSAGAGYSRARPPPHWEAAVRVLGTRGGAGTTGGAGAYGEFLRGGWREGERWWEEALGGAIEERRRAALEALEGVKRGMEMFG